MMSNLGKTFTVFAIIYFGMHLFSGFFFCQNHFCPGDNLTDWVYEYTDADGKKYIVEDGKATPAELYKESK